MGFDLPPRCSFCGITAERYERCDVCGRSPIQKREAAAATPPITIPMRTVDEVERAFGLIFIAEEILQQADWRGAAASWRSQIETAALLDPTLFIRATSGRLGADMTLKLILADAASAFLAVIAAARIEAADVVAGLAARRTTPARDRFDGRAA